MAVSTAEPDPAEVSGAQCKRWAYDAVRSLLSDDNNYERGVEQARKVAETVRVDAGELGLVETMVELAMKLAEALERIAAEQDMAAVDLAEVWFVE